MNLKADAGRVLVAPAATESAPRSLTPIGRLGLIAPKTQGPAAAQLSDSVPSQSTRECGAAGVPSRWRARIAVALGDRDRGVALLRQAMNEGLVFFASASGSPFHVDIDLEPLFGYQLYQELVAPKP